MYVDVGGGLTITTVSKIKWLPFRVIIRFFDNRLPTLPTSILCVVFEKGAIRDKKRPAERTKAFGW